VKAMAACYEVYRTEEVFVVFQISRWIDLLFLANGLAASCHLDRLFYFLLIALFNDATNY
jgi:hypothetical protein